MFLNDAQRIITHCHTSSLYHEAIASLQTQQNRFAYDAGIVHHTDLKKILFHSEHAIYNERIGKLISQYEDASDFPGLPALSVLALEYFKIDFNSVEASALMTCAVLGEIPNNNSFHNNNHFRKVFLAITRQIYDLNRIYANQPDKQLPAKEICLLLCAACIHDLNHDGLGNGKDKKHIPFRLERLAFESALPFLESAGLDEDFRKDLKVAILCTDVSPAAEPRAPNKLLKQAYNYLAHGKGKPPEFPPELERLNTRPDLCRLALLLHEADLIPSVGWGMDRLKKETVFIAKETGVSPTPSFEIFFMDHILGSFESPCGRLYNQKINSLKMAMATLRDNGDKPFGSGGQKGKELSLA